MLFVSKVEMGYIALIHIRNIIDEGVLVIPIKSCVLPMGRVAQIRKPQTHITLVPNEMLPVERSKHERYRIGYF